MTSRAEGVYVTQEQTGPYRGVVTIERVNGDGSAVRFSIAASEVESLIQQLQETHDLSI